MTLADPAMCLDGPSLCDLMTMLPQLHPKQLVLTQAATLKQLRLVSKEMNSLASAAVNSCDVHLGQGAASPSPQQLARLFVGAMPRKMTVNLTLESGPFATDIDQQLLACSDEMMFVTDNLAQEMRSIREVTLKVLHAECKLPPSRPLEVPEVLEQKQHSQQQQQQRQEQHQHQDTDGDLNAASDDECLVECATELIVPEAPRIVCPYAACPGHNAELCSSSMTACTFRLTNLCAIVFSELARAVPNLTHLNISGWCLDASLDDFGACCPYLINLAVEAPAVPVETLKGLGWHLPNLTTIYVGDYGESPEDEDSVEAYGEIVSAYTDAALCLIRECKNLLELDIDFEHYATLDCKSESWSLLPTSLKFFTCTCIVRESAAFDAWIHTLPRLSLFNCPNRRDSLVEVLQDFPLLEDLEVRTYEVPVLLECSVANSISAFKDRLLGGSFCLECQSIAFSGTCEEIRDVLLWLPAVDNVGTVTIIVEGGVKVQCLTRLALMFPDMTSLILEGEVAVSESISMDMEFFEPLKAATKLRHIKLSCKEFFLSNVGLVQLCLGLPRLYSLGVRHFERVNKMQLGEELLVLGKKMQVY